MKLMEQDLRKESRLNTHIVAEISIEGEFPNYCGYIENLSTEGMGLISLEMFNSETKYALGFYLAGVSGKISPKTTLVHSEKGAYNLYYHGFKFDSLTEEERRAIELYLIENALTRTA
jgi:hypothetical protein